MSRSGEIMTWMYIAVLYLSCLVGPSASAEKSEAQDERAKAAGEASYSYIISKESSCPRGKQCPECCNKKYKTCTWPLTLEGDGKINYTWATNMSPVLSQKTAEAFSKRGVRLQQKKEIRIEAFKTNGDLTLYATADSDGKRERAEIVESLSGTCGEGLEKCKEGCK
jgi:hypothetical protein